MSEASEASSTFAAGKKPITLPDWLPSAVARQAWLIEARCSSAEQRRDSCATGNGRPNARSVEGIDSPQSIRGGFLHSARWSLDKPVFKRRLAKPAVTQEEVQAEALGELFHFAFRAACDRVAVSKLVEVAPFKAILLEKARILNEIADDMAPMAYPLARTDAAALRRVAGWHEDCAALLRCRMTP